MTIRNGCEDAGRRLNARRNPPCARVLMRPRCRDPFPPAVLTPPPACSPVCLDEVARALECLDGSIRLVAPEPPRDTERPEGETP